jgi:hypothetical protein
MPVHDWTKVDAGIFHSFHLSWIARLAGKLNGGLLVNGFYGLSEPFSQDQIPGVPVRRTLTIRHTSGHRVVAFLEILSPGNKDGTASFEQSVNKVDSALTQGVHVMVVDLFPPGRFDPEGIHGAIWARYGTEEYFVPENKPLTLISYRAVVPVEAYLEHLAHGNPLPKMPLFLDPDTYVGVPLELTYEAAFQDMPAFWRDVLEGRRPAP